MAKLKDRRAAHRVVAELIQKSLPMLGTSNEVTAEIERIRHTHFAVGTIVDGGGDLEVLEPGALAMGGVYRCEACGSELADKAKRICAGCEAKIEAEKVEAEKAAEPKNGAAA